jgi:hypothetical protein
VKRAQPNDPRTVKSAGTGSITTEIEKLVILLRSAFCKQAVKNNCVKVMQNVTFPFVYGDGPWVGVGGDQRLCNRRRMEISMKRFY